MPPVRKYMTTLLVAMAIASSVAGRPPELGMPAQTTLPALWGCRLEGCCITDDGGIIAVGSAGTRDLDVHSLYAVKLDACCRRQWELTETRGSSISACDVLQIGRGYTLGGELTTRGGDRDGFIMRLDYFGRELWSTTLGGSEDDAIMDIAPAPDFGCYMVGFTESEGAGEKDVWVLRMDADGGTRWSRCFGGPSSEVGYDICVLPDQRLVVCCACGEGVELLFLDSEGHLVEQRLVEGCENGGRARSVVASEEGDLFLAGASEESDGYLLDALVVAEDRQGGRLWERRMGGELNDCGCKICMVGDSLLLAYNTMSQGAGSYDAVLELVSLQGELLGSSSFGDEGWNRVCDMEVDSTGRVFLCGVTGPADGRRHDGWVVLATLPEGPWEEVGF